MPSTRLPVLDDDPTSLNQIWDALAPEPAGRWPRIRAAMIASVDGTTTVDGRSAGLGTPTDRLVYLAMRARADLVVVGSGTALAEGYGPARIAEVWRDRAVSPPPVVLILTRSLSSSLIELCVSAGDGVQVAVDHGTATDRIEAAREAGVRVHVLQPGPTGDAVRALAASLRARQVVLEGGPTVLGRMLAEGAVDELVLSTSPELLIGGDGTPLVEATVAGTVRVPMRVAAAFTCPRGGLYTRWVVKGIKE